jgi:hypothetical protein
LFRANGLFVEVLMRRRDFIGSACGAAAATAALSGVSFAADDHALELLLELARVVLPDESSGAWTNGRPRRALEDNWRSLDTDTRKGYASILSTLDRKSVSSGGLKDFFSVPMEDRPAVVRNLLGESAEFREAFQRMRSMMLYAYYDSPVGMRRAGYYPTTQFEGYPELDKFPAGRNDG